VLFKSSIKLRLSALSYWYQRFKIRWKNRKTLLIYGFLLELPLRFRIAPHPPAYEAKPRSRMLHTDDTISNLEQILHTRNVESRKMVRQYRRLGNPKISQPWHTTLPFCENGSYSTQGMRRSSTASVAMRWIPIRLLHSLPLTKLQLVCEIHYEQSLQLCLLFGRLMDLCLQALLPQNLGTAGSQLLSVVHLESHNSQTY